MGEKQFSLSPGSNPWACGAPACMKIERQPQASEPRVIASGCFPMLDRHPLPDGRGSERRRHALLLVFHETSRLMSLFEDGHNILSPRRGVFSAPVVLRVTPRICHVLEEHGHAA